jgi:phage terminase large subunit-like protein
MKRAAKRDSSGAPSWQKELERTLRLIPKYDPWSQAGDAWLDHAAARQAIDFFAECLKHVEGDARGKPFVLAPWQQAIVGNLFGWKRKDEQGREVRRYRQCLLYVPRGNGKTPLAAGVCIYGLVCDNEPGAQIYLAAGKQDQAGYLFRNAKGMIEQEPELDSRIRVMGGDQRKTLIHKQDELSFCRVIPADGAGIHGAIPHITVIDELHAQRTRDLFDAFETALAKRTRRQPLLMMITTADVEGPSICNEVYQQACAVRDNGGNPEQSGYDPSFLPVIYEAEEADDWREESTWAKANPNLGVSVQAESLRTACRKAQENPARAPAFKQFHLNLRVGASSSVIDVKAWDACAGELPEPTGQVFGGLDLSSTEDLASFAECWRVDDRIALRLRVYCPEAKIGSRVRRRVPYDVWANRGHLIVTGGEAIDYDRIKADVLRSHEAGLLECAYDPWGAEGTRQDLEKAGVPCVKVPQNFGQMSAATKEFLRLVREGKLLHEGNPVAHWAAGNLCLHYDGRIPDGERIEDWLDKVPIMPSKRKSADKIDPIVAAILAISRLLAAPEEASSVYESRGLVTL